MICIKFIPSI